MASQSAAAVVGPQGWIDQVQGPIIRVEVTHAQGPKGRSLLREDKTFLAKGNNNSHCRLLALPCELRNAIYEHVVNIPRDHDWYRLVLYGYVSSGPGCVMTLPALCRVRNNQLREEVIRTLFRLCPVELRLDSLHEQDLHDFERSVRELTQLSQGQVHDVSLRVYGGACDISIHGLVTWTMTFAQHNPRFASNNLDVVAGWSNDENLPRLQPLFTALQHLGLTIGTNKEISDHAKAGEEILAVLNKHRRLLDRHVDGVLRSRLRGNDQMESLRLEICTTWQDKLAEYQ